MGEEQKASKLGLRLVWEVVSSGEDSSRPWAEIESSLFPPSSRMWQSRLVDASKGQPVDGNGCGGSQKGEIAKLDEMRRIDRSGRWDYDEVDVTDFLIAQFKPGDIVDAFDSDQNRFVTAELLQTPAPDDAKNHLEMKWQVVCKKTWKRFETKHLRHGTDFFEKLLGVFGKDSLEKIVQDATKLKVKSIYESRLQNGMLSLAVDFDLTCIQERHQLRDAVLGDDLVVSLNDALEKRGFTEQLAVDNTVFFQQYAASLLTFSQLTDHQTEKLKELSRYLHEDVHLSAPAGGGKTFLAVRHAMNKLRSSSKGKILFISPNRPLCFHFVHWLLMHARSSLPKVSRNKLLQRLVFMHAPYDSFTRAQIAADSYIVLEELKAMPDDLVLAIFDEAHAIFRTNQGIFQEVHAQRKLVLSDRSQSFLLETKYPEMRRVHLTEVVRSTKRLVLGANAFQLQDEPITCLGTTGPPLKSFIFESPKGVDHDFFTQFADHTVKALWFIMCTHPSIRLDRHVALLVPDEEFYRRFRFHLEDRLEAAFAPSYNIHLISFEDSLRFLPETAHQDRKRDELILDWDSNATGLEILFVVCIGFDVEIAGELDNFTRARLYHAITRAQLQAIVVDRLVQGGWLAYLTTLKLREMTFRLGDAESEINEDAALRIVMDSWW